MAILTGAPSGNHLPEVRFNSEQKLGILHYTSSVDFGWIGDIRKRYTDFIVHEVRKDGTVVYLTELAELADKAQKEPENVDKPLAAEQNPAGNPAQPEKPQEPVEISPEDAQSLAALIGAEAAKELQEAFAEMVSGTPVTKVKITFSVTSDRSQRGHIHQEVRRIFAGRFETQADPSTDSITAKPAPGRGKRGPRRNQRDSRGGNSGSKIGGSQDGARGPYLHFTLYKENKDTMEAINYLARLLKTKSPSFGFAGTKDRRAATTQRVSVKHHGSINPGWLNSRSNYIKVGDFSYNKAPIQLGQHGGNEFTIAIKNVELVQALDCSLSDRLRTVEASVQASLDHVQQHGFINYFGLQRFGTHAVGTQQVGLKILGGDFESACRHILHVDPAVMSRLDDEDIKMASEREEVNRARAIALFQSTGDATPALQTLPRRYSAESAILQHLSRPESRRDFCGALLKITRGLRNLYIHAYQSLVWNWVVSHRWSKFGSKVIAGDLVLVEPEGASALRAKEGSGDMSADPSQEEEQSYQESRALTAEEAASGKYTIFDIVLPVPGYDILYPENEIGDFYSEFMGRPENGGLDPYRMRRPQKEFSLSGYYRKIMARFSATPKFFVRPYTDDAEQMHPTDLDEIRDRTKDTEKTRVEDTVSKPHVDDKNLRRRLASDASQEALERRVSDAWIETKSGGGSKRAKTCQTEDGDNDMALVTAVSSNADSAVDGALPDAGAVSAEKSASSAPLPPTGRIVNVFREASVGEIADRTLNGAASKALNLTNAWRAGLPSFADADEMKIAVVLNFRLNSSNYATICMREMMSNSFYGTAETANNGNHLGHGGHIHSEAPGQTSGQDPEKKDEN